MSLLVEKFGGTPVRRTGETGLLRIVAGPGVASGIRPIEAVTGQGVASGIRPIEAVTGPGVLALLKHVGARTGARGGDRPEALAEALASVVPLVEAALAGMKPGSLCR